VEAVGDREFLATSITELREVCGAFPISHEESITEFSFTETGSVIVGWADLKPTTGKLSDL
jgi:hypothetical protein